MNKYFAKKTLVPKEQMLGKRGDGFKIAQMPIRRKIK